MNVGELVDRLVRGDETAGPILVSVVAPRLLGFAHAIGRGLSDVDIEAAVEKAIETSIRRIDRFDQTKGTFVGWTRTFVRNEILETRRQQAKFLDQLSEKASALYSAPGADDDDEPAVSPQVAAMAALVLTESEADQLLIQLRFHELLDHKEIAKVLGVTPEASRKRLQRLLERLRQRALDDPDLQHLKGPDGDD